MQDDVNWKLSLLMDDELPSDEAIALLERLQREPELQDKWYQYHLIRQVMRQARGAQVSAAFLEQVQAALATEPVLSATASDPAESFPTPPSRPFWHNPWLTLPAALAAGILVAVLAWRDDETARQPAMARAGATGKQANPPVRAQIRNARLDDYLFAHSEGEFYLPGAQHMLSYARIVSQDGR